MACNIFVALTWHEVDMTALEMIVLENEACQAVADSTSCLVRAIVPWGMDAIFNRLQYPSLISELREVAANQDSQEVRDNLEQVAQFIEDRMAATMKAGYVLFLAD
jgi:hypothetical protein